MSSFFEDLNNLVVDTKPGKVIVVAWLIMIFSATVALGIAWWITHRH